MDPLSANKHSTPIGYSEEDDPYAIVSPPAQPETVSDPLVDSFDRSSRVFEANPKIAPPSLSSFSSVALDPAPAYKSEEQVVIQITELSVGKHVTYSIKGEDRTGVFEISRRYRDFFALREYFVHRWPGVFIPPVPPKKIIGNKAEAHVSNRRKLLEEFLKKTVSITFLFRSDEFQMFIRGTSDFKGTCGQLKRYTLAEIAEIYRREFSEYAGRGISADVVAGLGVYQQFFKGVIDNLKEFKKIAKTAANYYSAFHENYERLAECFGVFEENCLSEYNPSAKRPVFLKWSAPIPMNPYQVIYDWLKMERLDVKAILEAMSRRDELQAMKEKLEGKLNSDNSDLSKLQSGKSTVSGFFSRKPKEVQISSLQEQIEHSGEEIKLVEQALAIVTMRLHAFEIPRFKEMKAAKYEMVMKSFASMSIAEYEEVIKICRAIESNLP